MRLWTGEAIQHVPPERMPFGQQRMIEVVRRIPGHTEPLHNPARTKVVWHCKRYDLAQTQLLKAERQGQRARPRWRTRSPNTLQLDAIQSQRRE